MAGKPSGKLEDEVEMIGDIDDSLIQRIWNKVLDATTTGLAGRAADQIQEREDHVDQVIRELEDEERTRNRIQ